MDSIKIKEEGEHFPILDGDIDEVWQNCVHNFRKSILEDGEPEKSRGYAWKGEDNIVLTCFMREKDGHLIHHHNAFVNK